MKLPESTKLSCESHLAWLILGRHATWKFLMLAGPALMRHRSLDQALARVASPTRLDAGWARIFARPVSRRRARLVERRFGTLAEEVPGLRSAKLARLEAALFAADEPLTGKRLAEIANLVDGAEARTLVAELALLYETDRSAFSVETLAGGWQLRTRSELAPWLARVHPARQDVRLSHPALETLAVVAYRQPVPRSDIEAIRGVACGEMLRQLIERGLVRIAGRHDSLGRPLLYGTTRKFLEVFGLVSLNDLPLADQLRMPQQTPDDAPRGKQHAKTLP